MVSLIQALVVDVDVSRLEVAAIFSGLVTTTRHGAMRPSEALQSSHDYPPVPSVRGVAYPREVLGGVAVQPSQGPLPWK